MAVHGPKICEPGGGGMFFPIFPGEQTWPDLVRCIFYLLALVYLFMGVDIVSNKFVDSIEVITSRKKRVRQKSTGKIVTVVVWNSTVSNLTLMALGSSAPEILLSVVETVANDFHAGQLGPATIVGSAAFNLFMIIAVCIMAIPSPDTRRIKEHGVFVITAVFSLAAYVWMVVICQLRSPDVIEIWEGLATVALLPALIGISYLADVGYFSGGKQPTVREVPLPPQLTPQVQRQAGPEASYWHSANSAAQLALADAEGAPARHGCAAEDDAWLTFPADTIELQSGLVSREVLVPVLRTGNCSIDACCKYRLEGLSAVPGYDFVASSGVLEFPPLAERAMLPVTLLPKRIGEHSDCFQIVLCEAGGGAKFNPYSDGGPDSCVLTVTVGNENDNLARGSSAVRLNRWADGVFNMDALRYAAEQWRQNVRDAVFEVGDDDDDDEENDSLDDGSSKSGSPSAFDYVMHVVSLPWKLTFSLVMPPAVLAGGWACFVMSLALIGLITTWVIDFAELFGCVTGIEDSITAITFVALGTSMPDMFASRSAACQDDTADASIVNVTGSNSVNVFLGIGLPWTMAAIYWAVVGVTSDKVLKHGDLVHAHPEGAFIVPSGDLSFSVLVFGLAALVALLLLHVRRTRFGGELGGPYTAKVLSALLLVLLWCFYIALSIWKVTAGPVSFGEQVGAIFFGVCVLENLLLVIGALVFIMQARASPASKEHSDLDLECASKSGDGSTASSKVIVGEPTGLAPPLPTRRIPSFGHGGECMMSGYHGDVVFGSTDLRQLASVGLPRDGACSLATMYGSHFQDNVSMGHMSFASAAMVCLAVNRFKSTDRRGRSSSEAMEALPAQSPLRRECSFHSSRSLLEDEADAGTGTGSSSSGTTPMVTPRSGAAISVASRMADYVGRNAVDFAALSAAGYAAAQLVDPEVAATLMGAS